MQYLITFIRISRPIAHVKKSTLINDWENIFAYWLESKQCFGLGEQVRFDPITVDESGGNPI